jgi:TRAP-type mannitol/chloroaromatic compound transport system substrate-binding protein
MVPPLQALDAVIDGSAEMSHGAAYYWQNKSVGLSFFTGVPFGMTSRELAAWVRYLGGQEIWDEIYDQFGLRASCRATPARRPAAGSRTRSRISSSSRACVSAPPASAARSGSAWALSVTNLAGGEIFQALQSGALDAAEFVGPYNDLALGFHQVRKHYYTSSFIEPGLATELVVDKAKYQELPANLQRIIRDVCQAEYDQVASDFYANDPRALRTLVEEHDVIVHPEFPEDVLEAGAMPPRTS